METPSPLRVRNTLSSLFLALLILDTTLVFLSKDLWAIGRIIFTAGVMYFVLQGYRWAKWLLIGILTVVTLALIALVILLSAKLSTVIAVGSIVMAVLCCIVIGYLLRYAAQLHTSSL